MVGRRRVPASSPVPLTACGRRLRVLLAGFEVDPEIPSGIGGVPIEVVYRARTASEVATSVEEVGFDVVLGDAGLANIAARLQESGTVALLRSEVDEVAAHGGRAVHALAGDIVETVLAVASVRVFSPAKG